MLVSEENGQPRYLKKNLSEQMREPTKPQPTYGATPGFEPRATLMGGDCSHHSTTLGTRMMIMMMMMMMIASEKAL